MTVEGVDPSEGQLAFARERLATPVAKFRQGDAMALPFADGTFDAAVMALVVFFIPDPAKGVAEMARVVRPRGCLCLGHCQRRRPVGGHHNPDEGDGVHATAGPESGSFDARRTT